MPWLEKRGRTFRIKFRYAGQNLSKTLKTGDTKEAQACVLRLEENLRLVERGRLEVPPGEDLPTFLLSDGKVGRGAKPAPTVTLESLFKQYKEMLPAGAMEQNSLETVELHMRHVKRLLGARLLVQSLTFSVLQGYVESRSREKSRRGQSISPITIRKELTSFSGIWTWARQAGLVQTSFPNRGLKYPKTSEKPPFQTWKEIERQIADGGLTDVEQNELWDCLFLTLPELERLLDYVREHARYPFIFPMIAFAAHTGARRSEVIRSRRSDFQFDSMTVVIREKKRAKGKRTTRRVPLTPYLASVMRDWLGSHPGGVYTICQPLHVSQGGKVHDDFGPLTRNEANHHFQYTLADSKWAKLKGWHCLRHSFCSNCAARGIDQRIINEWTGHQSEEMARRYRHLIPNQQRQAIELVFGPGLRQ